MLQHLAENYKCNENDEVLWLQYYFGKEHDETFTLASEAPGFPSVQCLDATSALAM
jgi:hypothetical protein